MSWKAQDGTEGGADILEELFHGDLGFDEMIPVDSFFDSYVDQLQEVGNGAFQKQQQQQQQQQQIGFAPTSYNQTMYADSGGYGQATQQQFNQFNQYQINQNIVSGSNGSKAFLAPANNQHISIPSTNFAGYMDEGAQNQTRTMNNNIYQFQASRQMVQPVMQPQHNYQQYQQQNGFSVNPVQQKMLGNHREGATKKVSSDGNTDKMGGSEEDEQYSNDKNSGGTKGRRVRNRTPKQQALNKQAQQRYRERKKNKAVNMERTVEALSSEVQDLRKVKEIKTQLEDKASELEQRLLEKEAELNRLKAEIHNHMKAGGSSVASSSMVAADSPQSSPLIEEQFDLNKEALQLATRYHSNVDELRKIVKDIGCEDPRTTDIYGTNIDASDIKRIKQIVMDICMTCMRALRMEGVDIWNMISANLKTAPNQNKKWNCTVTATRLGFTLEQKQRALALRKEYLKKLQEIFGQRQGLNLQAIGVLLPSDQGGQGPNLSKVGFLSMMGFFSRARHNGRLNKVLEALRENLRAEQRAASELDYIVFQRLFTPIQGAWFVLECYPDHCDCLDLLNGCEQAFGSEVNIS